MCKQDSARLGTGTFVPFNFKCWATEDTHCIFCTLVSSRRSVHMVSCLLPALMITMGPAKKKKRKKTSHCRNKNVPVLCILYVSKQHNQCRIYTRQCLKKHNMVPQLYCDLLFTQRAFLLWLSYATCHWNVFFMFLISLNVKHLLLREPNPSDDFSTPLKWKWRMWQNSGINIIKEFDLQKPQHLLGWGE